MRQNLGRFKKNKEYFFKQGRTAGIVQREVNRGLKLLNTVNQPIVTFFGSHAVKPNNANYQHAKKLATELGENGFAIMTGGGPGIMEAANRGASRAQVRSIVVRAKLFREETVKNKNYTDRLDFHFLFIRRFILSIKSEALVFYPGGYGTLNELFEFLVLIQNGVVDQVPIIAVNRQYWTGLFTWMSSTSFEKNHRVPRASDLRLVTFVDTVHEAKKLIIAQP